MAKHCSALNSSSFHSRVPIGCSVRIQLRSHGAIRLRTTSRPGNPTTMSDNETSFHKAILKNQADILRNQAVIKKNQQDIKANQKKLDQILANQKSILANQKKILSK
jgi:hypothetical protein